MLLRNHTGRTLNKRLNASLFARGDPHNTSKIVPKCRGDWFRYGLRAQRSQIGGRMGVFASKGKPCRWQYGGEKAFIAMSYMALWDMNLWITVFHCQLRGYLGWSMYRNVWITPGMILEVLSGSWLGTTLMIAMNIYEDVYAVCSSKPLESANHRGFDWLHLKRWHPRSDLDRLV